MDHGVKGQGQLWHSMYNGLAKISVPSMLHFDEKIKFHEFCSK